MRRILRKILRKLGKLREIPEIMQSAPEGCVRGKGTLFIMNQLKLMFSDSFSDSYSLNSIQIASF